MNKTKMSIDEFTGDQIATANAEMVQDLFLKIPVQDLFLTLIKIDKETKGGGVRHSVSYLNTFMELNKKIPRLSEMNIGQLLQLAIQRYMTQEGEIGEAAARLGNTIVKSILVEAFCTCSTQKKCTYEKVLQKLVRETETINN